MLSDKENKILQDYEENIKIQKNYKVAKENLKKVLDNYKTYNMSEELYANLLKLFEDSNVVFTEEKYENFKNNFCALNNILKNKNTISNGEWEDYKATFVLMNDNRTYWNLCKNGKQEAMFLVNFSNKYGMTYIDNNLKADLSFFSSSVFVYKINKFNMRDDSLWFKDEKINKELIRTFKNMFKLYKKIENMIFKNTMSIGTANIFLEAVNSKNYNEMIRIIESKKECTKELGQNIKIFSEIAKDVINMTHEEREQVLLLTDIDPKKYLKNDIITHILTKTKNKLSRKK